MRRFNVVIALLALFGLSGPNASAQTLYALTNANQMVSFGAATPGTVISTVTFTGLQAGEKITGIDVRPATGELYALGLVDDGATRTGRIYKVNPFNGAATLVGAAPWSTSLPDTDFGGFNFNPLVDRIRVVFSFGANFRVHPDTGALVAADTNLSQTVVNGVSYTNNVIPQSGTTLYGMRYANDTLVLIGGLNGVPSPNGGVVTSVGGSGISAMDAYGFEIVTNGLVDKAFATADGKLYSVNLATGAFTLVGAIGAGNLSFLGLTAQSTVPPMHALTNNNQLLTFRAATPGALISTATISGLQAGEKITGIDVRPATNELYALGLVDDGATRTGRIYRVNPTTGVATQVGAAPWSSVLPDTDFGGINFSPIADVLRVVFSNGGNFRVNPNTGALLATDTPLSPTATNGISYTNSDLLQSGTTLYGLKFDNDTLVTIGGINGSPSPNSGVVTAVGSTGIVSNDAYGLEIRSTNGVTTAFATSGGRLYSVNLSNGAFTQVGAVGSGSHVLLALTAANSGDTIFRNGYE